MHRLLPLLAISLLPLGCRSGGSGSEAEAEKRPNILIVYTDDHACHAISAYGSKINQTPNIDRLAGEGMLFANSFVGNSICSPCRATVLTGVHSHVNGVLDNSTAFDGSQQTFPRLLQASGYQTAIVGKWHLHSDPTGFDHWEVLRGQGPYYNPDLLTPEGTVAHTGYTTQVLTDRALAWLEEARDPDRPFLLMYQHKAPHREWSPGPEYLGMYDHVDMPEPDTLFDDYSGRATPAAEQEMTLARHFYDLDMKLRAPGNLNEEQLAAWNAAYGPKNEAYAGLTGDDQVRWRYQRYIKDYLRCIAAVDDELGRVLDWLDAEGLAGETVVVYGSDQGFYLGDHGWYDKRWMYEESLRTPLIVRWPEAVRAGSVEEHLVQNIDLAPTFLELAGVSIPNRMQGDSLVPLLRGMEPVDWRGSVYYHYYEYPAPHRVREHYGVRTERFKLISYYTIDEWELFDLERDPKELRSVADDPAYAEIRKVLEGELRRLQEQYGDTDPDVSWTEMRQRLALAAAREVVLEQVVSIPRPMPGNAPPPGSPAGKPLTAGSWCQPSGPNDILLAHGGESYGYAVYLRDARPCFAVRNGSSLFEVQAPASIPMGSWSLVVGVLTAEQELQLFVDGRQVARADGSLISRGPSDGFNLGLDDGSAVGRYGEGRADPPGLANLRVYWGALDEAGHAAWVTDRP